MANTRHSSDPDLPRPAGEYDYILSLSDQELAWEFLRRNSEYQRAYQAADTVQVEPQHLQSGAQYWRVVEQDRLPRRWGLETFR